MSYSNVLYKLTWEVVINPHLASLWIIYSNILYRLGNGNESQFFITMDELLKCFVYINLRNMNDSPFDITMDELLKCSL